MFSSNQIFDVSCRPQDLERVIAFGVECYNASANIFTRLDGRIKMAFAEPVPGVYAIGTGSMQPYQIGPNKGWSAKIGRGWTDYPFDYDPEIIAKVIGQWLEKNPPGRETRPDTDGSVHPGIRVRCLSSIHSELPPPHELLNWDWMDAILLFTPCWMRYDK